MTFIQLKPTTNSALCVVLFVASCGNTAGSLDSSGSMSTSVAEESDVGSLQVTQNGLMCLNGEESYEDPIQEETSADTPEASIELFERQSLAYSNAPGRESLTRMVVAETKRRVQYEYQRPDGTAQLRVEVRLREEIWLATQLYSC